MILMNAALRKMKSHVFRGLRYKIKVGRVGPDIDGLCQAPGMKGKAITIRPSLSGKRLLQVLLDEAIHATCYDLDNEAVGEMSDAMGDFLWRAGYRLEGEK